MDAQTIERYGDELYQSLLSRIPVEPLTNRESDITVADAYQIQLRALVKHLSGISDADITSLEIPTGQPIVYDLNGDLTARERYYLSER